MVNTRLHVRALRALTLQTGCRKFKFNPDCWLDYLISLSAVHKNRSTLHLSLSLVRYFASRQLGFLGCVHTIPGSFSCGRHEGHVFISILYCQVLPSKNKVYYYYCYYHYKIVVWTTEVYFYHCNLEVKLLFWGPKTIATLANYTCKSFIKLNLGVSALKSGT